MQTMIVYVDDAEYALRKLCPPRPSSEGQIAVRWVLVACAPRVTQHVSKWVTRSARESWRGKWAEKLFARLVPELQRRGDQVITCVGKINLLAHTDALLLEYEAARVIDVRRPKASDGGATRPEAGLMSWLMVSASTGLWAVVE